VWPPRQSPPACGSSSTTAPPTETPAILEEYARKLPYLKVVRRADRGHRSVGPGVIEAFYAGLDTVDLDAFPSSASSTSISFSLPLLRAPNGAHGSEPAARTTSGKPYFERHGRLVPRRSRRGLGRASKFYRTQCFREIGGFVRAQMWDRHRLPPLPHDRLIPESVNDEHLRFLHLRPMGSSDRGLWTGYVRSGYGQYFMGTSPTFLLASAAYRLFKHPVLYGSVAILWGYFSSAARACRATKSPGSGAS